MQLYFTMSWYNKYNRDQATRRKTKVNSRRRERGAKRASAMAWRQCRRQDSSHGVSHNASRSLGCAGCNAADCTLLHSPLGPSCSSSSFYIFPGTVGTVVFLIYTLPPPVERRAHRERVLPLFNRIPSYSVYGTVNTGFVGPATSPFTTEMHSKDILPFDGQGEKHIAEVANSSRASPKIPTRNVFI